MDEKWEVRPGSDLAAVIEKVEHGETVDVTRHGEVVAQIVPIRRELDGTKFTPPTLEELQAYRKKFTLGPDLTIRDLVDEGRKY